jgi:type II secretory ATPase GspE/PulE/Tfp pilus assembly ATPase PilB-like protein
VKTSQGVDGELPRGAVEIVDSLLLRAKEMGASDLHLDPEETGLRARVRCAGVLQELDLLPADLAPVVVGRLKAMAELLAYRTDVPQEGRMERRRSPVGDELRVATFPTIMGERVAIRFDASGGEEPTLEDLGLEGDVLADLQVSLDQPAGAIFVTGPSGSGKTTTLYACLRHVLAGEPPRSIVTLEDPVERRLAGTVQGQVRPASGFTFARGLRSILRQDPEVILIGEIRDAETARIALEAALTGHLVLSTVHAGTAPGVFARLLEMGIEPFVLTTAVRGVIGQRLVRRHSPEGWCGRRLVAEWLPLSQGLRSAVLRRADDLDMTAAAVADGYRTMREVAAELVLRGETTSDEVTRVLGIA